MPIDRLSTLITRALRDGRVDLKETKALIAETSTKPTLSSDDRQRLRTFLDQNMSKFDDAAQLALEQYLSSTPASPNARRVSEPPLMNETDRATTAWKDVIGGKLYVDGIDADDITQGEAGDCYLLSTLAVLAKTNPDAIKNAITDNGDGTFDVRFFEKGKRGKLTEVVVTVDGKLPTGPEGSVYAASRNTTELWGPIIEKAYASWYGGYENIGQGGMAGDVLLALTGRKSDYVDHIADTTDSQLWSKMSAASKERRPMVAGTYDEDAKIDYESQNMSAGHAYSVFGVSEKAGERFVTLRDPHGTQEWGNDGKVDGIFTMPFSKFRELYDDLYVSR
jgi:hypothetical protein